MSASWLLPFLLAWAVDPAGVDPGVVGQGAVEPGTEGPVVVPFVLEHGLVFVDVELAGRGSVLALLDTGANASAIDPRRSDDLAVLERAAVVGTTGTLEAEMVRLEGARLGALALPALRASRRDLGGLLAPEGSAVEMILGSDALVGLAVTLDFVEQRLELAPSRKAADGAADASVGGRGASESTDALRGNVRNAVPMLLDDGIPAIEASLGGVTGWLRIDTGASLFDTPEVYVNVPTRTWEALLRRHEGLAPSTSFQGTGADGAAVDLPVARIPDVRIGPTRLDHAFVIVQPRAGYFAAPEAKGFVGNNFLRTLGRVTLDYGAGRLRVDVE